MEHTGFKGGSVELVCDEHRQEAEDRGYRPRDELTPPGGIPTTHDRGSPAPRSG